MCFLLFILKGGLIRSIVVTREALLLSLAAAVSVGDEEVVLEVARIMRQDHGELLYCIAFLFVELVDLIYRRFILSLSVQG